MEEGGGNEDVEGENILILKKKLIVLDKLLKNKEKLELQNSDLNTETMLKDKKIQSLQTELEELHTSLDQKSAKLKSTEKEKRDLANSSRQLEASVAKINSDFLNLKVESNSLKSKIDDLEAENETLNEKLQNDSTVRKLKSAHEEENWRHLAEISKLKQQNESLTLKVEEQAEATQDYEAISLEFKRLKKENSELQRSLDEGKKDRQIAALNRKLEKAERQIKRLSKQAFENVDDCYLTPHHESEGEATGSEGLNSSVHIPTQPIEKQRFPIIFPLSRSRATHQPNKQNRKRCSFLKVGSLAYTELPEVLGVKPVISFSNPMEVIKEPTQESHHKLLNDEQIRFLEDILDIVTPDDNINRKRKRGRPMGSINHKRMKGDRIDFNQSTECKKNLLSAIKVISPESINNSYNIASMETEGTSEDDLEPDLDIQILSSRNLSAGSDNTIGPAAVTARDSPAVSARDSPAVSARDSPAVSARGSAAALSRVSDLSGEAVMSQSAALEATPLAAAPSAMLPAAALAAIPLAEAPSAMLPAAALAAMLPAGSLTAMPPVSTSTPSRNTGGALNQPIPGNHLVFKPSESNSLLSLPLPMLTDEPMSSSTPNRTPHGSPVKPSGSIQPIRFIRSAIINIDEVKSFPENQKIDENKKAYLDRKEQIRREEEIKDQEKKDQDAYKKAYLKQKDQEMRNQEKRDQEKKDQEMRNQEKKDQEKKNKEKKDQEKKNKEKKDQEMRNQEKKDQEKKDQEMRNQEKRDQEKKDQQRRDQEKKDLQRKDNEEKDQQRKDNEEKDQEKKDQQRKDNEEKDQEKKNQNIKEKDSESSVSMPVLLPESYQELDGQKSIYYNPNPSRARRAHHQQNNSLSSLASLNALASTKGVSTNKLSTSLNFGSTEKSKRGTVVPPPQSYESKNESKMTRLDSRKSLDSSRPPLVSFKSKSAYNETKFVKSQVVKKTMSQEIQFKKSSLNTGAAVGGARAKVLSKGFSIETPLSVVKNQTDAEKAEQKRHMVGRAAPGVATRVSKDGFRAFEPVAKSGDVTKAGATTAANGKGVTLKPKNKAVNCDDVGPERKKTQPAKMTIKSRLSTNPSPTDAGENDTGDPKLEEKDKFPPKVLPKKISDASLQDKLKEVKKKLLEKNVNKVEAVASPVHQSDHSDDSSDEDEVDPEALFLQKQQFSQPTKSTGLHNVKQKPSNIVPATDNQKSAKLVSRKSSKSSANEDTARLSPEDSKKTRKSPESKNEVAFESESSTSSDEEIDLEDLAAKKAALAANTNSKVDNTVSANEALGNGGVKYGDKSKMSRTLSDDSSNDDEDDIKNEEQLLLQKMKELHESPEKDSSSSDDDANGDDIFAQKALLLANHGDASISSTNENEAAVPSANQEKVDHNTLTNKNADNIKSSTNKSQDKAEGMPSLFDLKSADPNNLEGCNKNGGADGKGGQRFSIDEDLDLSESDTDL